MEKTTRRNLLKAAAIGGVTATGLSAVSLAAKQRETRQKKGKNDEHAHDNRLENSGKRAHVVVTFRSMGSGSKRYPGTATIAACRVLPPPNPEPQRAQTPAIRSRGRRRRRGLVHDFRPAPDLNLRSKS